jgi:hypothetical protein
VVTRALRPVASRRTHRGRLSSWTTGSFWPKAEQVLTEIKVAQGLSERHEAVLAALRIRLKGNAGKSLEEMLEAADEAPPDRLGEAIAKVEGKGKPSLDDLLSKGPKEKPDWPS